MPRAMSTTARIGSWPPIDPRHVVQPAAARPGRDLEHVRLALVEADLDVRDAALQALRGGTRAAATWYSLS